MTVVVIGGGISGLSAAHALAGAGRRVTLFERAARLGGKIRTDHADGFLLEAGPDAFLAAKPQAAALCRAVGLGDQLVGVRPGPVFVYARGALRPLPAGVRLAPTRLRPLIGSGFFTPRELLRIASEPFRPARRATGDESLGALVRRRFGQAALDRLVAPLAAGIHAADPEALSVAATFPRLAAAEREHGSLMRGLRAAVTEPPVAGGNGTGEGPMFLTLAGGLETLVARLVDTAPGLTVHAGCAVTRIAPSGSGFVIETADGSSHPTDAVVLAVPAPVAATLLAPLAPTAAALLARIEHVTTAVVALGYAERDVPRAAGHGFVVARDAPAEITACTWSSAKWPGRAPAGYALLRVYLGRAGQPIPPGTTDAALVAAARADLARMMGVSAEPVLARVAWWEGGMPQYAVGHLERMAAVERALEALPGLVLAGAGYRGSGVPDCIAQGHRAAERLAGGGVLAGGPPRAG